uniref:Uncharacterized protein n=1 Tax=Tetranychus urticae TaxID=32264 RepID=T1L4K8_TETUR
MANPLTTFVDPRKKTSPPDTQSTAKRKKQPHQALRLYRTHQELRTLIDHMVKKNRKFYGALKYDIYYEHPKFLELNKEYKHQPRNEEYVSADIHRKNSAMSCGKRGTKVFKCPYCAYVATGGYKSSVMRHINGRQKPGSQERETPACGQRKLVEPAIADTVVPKCCLNPKKCLFGIVCHRCAAYHGYGRAKMTP